MSNYAKTDDPRKAKLFKTVQEATVKADLELKGFSFRVEPSHTGRPGYVLKCWPVGQLHYQEGRFWVTDARAAAIRYKVQSEDVLGDAHKVAETVLQREKKPTVPAVTPRKYTFHKTKARK